MGVQAGVPSLPQDGKVVGLQARVRNAEKRVDGVQSFLAISLLIPSPEVLAFIKSCGRQLGAVFALFCLCFLFVRIPYRAVGWWVCGRKTIRDRSC